MNHIHNLIWAIVQQQDGLSTIDGKKGDDNNDLYVLRKSQPPQSWGVNLHKVCLESLLYG